MPQLFPFGRAVGGGPEQADPGEDLVEQLLSRLDTGQAPPPPPRRGIGRTLLGGIGDALVAQASVLAGGRPPQIGASTAIEQERQQEYRLAKARFDEKQSELSNEILKIKAQLAIAAEKRTLDEQDAIRGEKRRDELLRKRQAETDERTANRQREDDERDAEIALNKAKRDRVFQLQKELLDAGITEDVIPQIDPKLMTMAQLVDLGLQVRQSITGKAPSHAERLEAQIATAKEVDPELQISGIAATGKDGVMNVRMAKDPLKRLSATDARLAMNAGIPLFHDDGTARSVIDIDNEIAARKNEDREQKIKERDLRLAAIADKLRRPKGTVGTKISENLSIIQNAEAAIMLLSGASSSPGGPIAGRFPPGLRYATLELFGSKKGADLNREVTIRVQNIFNILAKIRSGAAVTLPEEIRLVPELAVMTDTKSTMLKKLRLLVEERSRFVDILQNKHSLLDSDFEYLSGSLVDPTFIPIEPEAGDILIFGGDQ